jgi:hypothetical protein
MLTEPPRLVTSDLTPQGSVARSVVVLCTYGTPITLRHEVTDRVGGGRGQTGKVNSAHYDDRMMVSGAGYRSCLAVPQAISLLLDRLSHCCLTDYLIAA